MKKLKWFLIPVAIAALLGCAPTYTEETGDFKMPRELSDCKIFKLKDGTGTRLYVTRCSNKDNVSTLLPGKHPVYTATVEEGYKY